MESINWERDKVGSIASIKSPKSARFVSPSAAAFMVKSLMHEVTTISASFISDDVVVFSRLAGISVFAEKHADYYGLYASSGAASEVNFCLRRCTWERAFRSTEEVLKTLSAQTLFFDVERLELRHRNVVLAVDSRPKDDYQIRAGTSSNDAFVGKQISYFVSDDMKDLSCSYRGESSTNPAVEELFHELEVLFDALAAGASVEPLPESLRISYSFFPIAESLGFAG